MAKPTLDDLLNDADEFGLLDVKPVTRRVSSEEDRIRQDFEQINIFIDRHGYLPGKGPDTAKVEATEKMMQFRLISYLSKPELCAKLAPLDRHGILVHQPEGPVFKSLDDILNSDDELLATRADDIFTFERAPVPKAKPDWKSERRRCENFEQFKPMFDKCALEIKAGIRETRRFKN